ncbi:DUF1345 domain-containing protein [Flavobacterium aquidurense]|uniref:DUF1345 domain-containing protein n=1 Tax=Flavobacterium piscisymbiosum TaxID=2893753 RepID=A0ABS8MM29_9FLAO|nr:MULTISPECIES: DUF1345 domain-containing protein [unclassified Flavobacterium]KQO24892.1 hypothetical protein ASF10_06865 [Flavobacterium sp. Leaf82]MCC9065986.1 DUF1345 domain-containing protein [Flavobacterium sp. F-30]
MNATAFINRLSNRSRLIISSAAGGITAIIIGSGTNKASVHLMAVWLAFSLTHLFFAWFTILTCRVDELRISAKKQDSGRTVLSVFMLLTTSVSLMGILLLYLSAGQKTGTELITHTVMTLSSVGTAWSVVHTTFAFKYANLHYSYDGLDFPGEKEPDYLDFVYFSFVIGTTFQVSDVSILNRKIRRTALLHGVLSFLFNTTILALGINIISSMAQK